ncbi:LysR family transcriptional regulator, partial [Acinetobacter baumannii]
LLTLAVLARSGSYAACARELGLTHATVIRRLRRLETALGAPVAESMPGRIERSPAGRIALAAAEQMERHAARIGRELEARR